MLSAAVLLVLIAALRHPYRLERIRTFLDPARDPTGTTYQVIQGIRAVGSGWITGLGFGQGRGKFYLPAANTDYIFATLAEELGFIGSVLLIALFVVLGYRAFVIARCAPDRFGTLTAAGIGAWFTSQSLLNMLVVTGAAPATGVPLPFVSYGGSSLVVALIGIGVLLNISQYRSERPSGAGPIRT
jgi:cell division protein FtsW